MSRSFALTNAILGMALFTVGCARDVSGADLGPGSGGDGGMIHTNADADFCNGKGPLVMVGDGQTTQTLCTGQIAQATFQNALCTCNNAELAGYLLTRGMNSTNPADNSDGGASVGINNSYAISAGFSDVGGSFDIAGTQGLTLAGYVAVRGDLRMAGSATIAGLTTVARNAWLAGTYTDLGPMTIDGDLHHAGAVNAIPLTVKGKSTQQAVTILPPCDCAAKDILDIGALVDAAKLQNDNATIGLMPGALDGTLGQVDLTLPCGKFFLTRISGLGKFTVHVTGRVALFIDGDIDATGIVQFQLAPSTEIDIFVRNNLALTGEMSFGDKSHPAGTRIYVGGTKDVVLIGAAGFVGNLYAPRANVTAVGYAEVWGSIFANNFTVPGYTHIIFDRAILTAGSTCGLPPPTTCTLCGVCANGQGCVNNQCVDCKTDADCCGQQSCNNGFCGPVIQ